MLLYVSPKANANLLSHTEVVALINTLHRFSESLRYVDDFRQMWADTTEEQSQNLIHDAEKAVIGHVSPFSSFVAENAILNFYHSLEDILRVILELKAGGRGCKDLFLTG